jgi:FkbM family methyltransferase
VRRNRSILQILTLQSRWGHAPASELVLPARLNKWLSLLIRPEHRLRWRELRRVQAVARYTPGRTNMLGIPVEFVDSASFLFMYNEIFVKEIYKFPCRAPKPLVIDCGANIGLSIIYFKRLHPDATVIAFEPDSQAFAALQRNVARLSVADTTLHNKAVWTENAELDFMFEGADSGRVGHVEDGFTTYKVAAVRLRDFLTTKIAFLKMDIEGAETAVLADCEDLLHMVDSLFVEYHSFVSDEQTLHILTNLLHRAGFRLYIVNPADFSPSPLWQRTAYLGMDVQLNIFGYRPQLR